MAIRRCFAVLYFLAAFVIASIAVASLGFRSSSAVTIAAPNAPAKAVSAPPQLVSSKTAHVPLTFEEADGPAGAAFISRGAGYALMLARDVLAADGAVGEDMGAPELQPHRTHGDARHHGDAAKDRLAATMLLGLLGRRDGDRLDGALSHGACLVPWSPWSCSAAEA